MFDNREGVKGLSIPPYSKTCTMNNCDEQTDVVVLVVTENGQTKSGAFPRFGYVQKDNLMLHPQYQFKRWVTRCADCYMADVVRAGRQHIKIESDSSFVSANQSRLAE